MIWPSGLLENAATIIIKYCPSICFSFGLASWYISWSAGWSAAVKIITNYRRNDTSAVIIRWRPYSEFDLQGKINYMQWIHNSGLRIDPDQYFDFREYANCGWERSLKYKHPRGRTKLFDLHAAVWKTIYRCRLKFEINLTTRGWN